MGSDVPAPTHARSPSIDTGRAQPAEGNGIDARICSYAHAKHTPKLLGGTLSCSRSERPGLCVRTAAHTFMHTHAARGPFSGYQQPA